MDGPVFGGRSQSSMGNIVETVEIIVSIYILVYSLYRTYVLLLSIIVPLKRQLLA